MNLPMQMTTAEHTEAAARALSLAEAYVAEQKYDRIAAYSTLALAHLALADAKRRDGQ